MALDSDVAFRHAGWQATRRRVGEAFERLQIPAERQRAFASCGSWAWVVRHPKDPDRYAIQSDKCHDRFCLPCSLERSYLIANRLAERLIRKPHRLITLTIRSGSEPLRDLLAKLQTGFSKLRRSKPWKGRIIGGVAFTEVHWNEDTNRWHPHLHIVCEGSYIPQDQLSDAWLRITGDSCIVDVRLINDAEKACRYVAKYAAKGLSQTFINRPDKMDEAITAIGGRRLANTFGNWRKWQLYQQTEHVDWLPVAPLADFRDRAASGDEYAICLLQSLRRNVRWDHPLNKSPPTKTLTADGRSASSSIECPSVLDAE